MSESEIPAPSRRQRLLDALEPAIFRHRLATLGALLALSVLLGWQAARLRINTSFDDLLPLQHPWMQVYKQYEHPFGGANTVTVAMVERNGDLYNARFLHALKLATDAMLALPHVDKAQVRSLFSPGVRYIDTVDGGFFSDSVIPADFGSAAPTPEMLDKVRDHVAKAGVVGWLVSNDQRGALVQGTLLETDPASGARADYRALAPLIEDRLRQRFASPNRYDNRAKADIVVGEGCEPETGSRLRQGQLLFHKGEWVAQTYAPLEHGPLRWLGEVVATRQLADGTTATVRVRGRLLDAARSANPDYAPEVIVALTGFARESGDLIDLLPMAALFCLPLLAAALVLLWLQTGSLRLALLPVLATVLTLVWMAGGMGLAGLAVNPYALVVPFVAMAISLMHGARFVTACSAAGAQGDGHSVVRAVWRALAPRALLAPCGVVAVGAALATLQVGLIDQMSIALGLAMVAVLLMNGILLPLALDSLGLGHPDRLQSRQAARERLFAPLYAIYSGLSRTSAALPLVLVCAVLAGWGLWQGVQLRVGDGAHSFAELDGHSRYNREAAAISSYFPRSADVIKVLSESGAEACTRYQIMDQVDTLDWDLANTTGVRSTLSLPQLTHGVYSIFSDGSPKFRVLPRNKDALAQTITPIQPSSGLLSDNCALLPVLAFANDHRAATLGRIADRVAAYSADNDSEFFKTHKDVNAGYCAAQVDARREVGRQQRQLNRLSAKAREGGLFNRLFLQVLTLEDQQKSLALARDKLKGMNRECPVNFSIAAGDAGVAAAADDLLEHMKGKALLYAGLGLLAVAYIICSDWLGVIAVLLPVSLVGALAYAMMSVLGIGLKLDTLPWVAFVLAIGADFGIHLYADLAAAHAAGTEASDGSRSLLRSSGRAIVCSGLILLLGALAFTFSPLQLQSDLGKLLLSMLSAELLGLLLIAPCMAAAWSTARQSEFSAQASFKPGF